MFCMLCSGGLLLAPERPATYSSFLRELVGQMLNRYSRSIVFNSTAQVDASRCMSLTSTCRNADRRPSPEEILQKQEAESWVYSSTMLYLYNIFLYIYSFFKFYFIFVYSVFIYFHLFICLFYILYWVVCGRFLRLQAPSKTFSKLSKQVRCMKLQQGRFYIDKV